MTELADLRRDLEDIQSVEVVSVNKYTIDIAVSNGNYDSLTTEVLSTIVSYDGSLYTDERLQADHTIVV